MFSLVLCFVFIILRAEANLPETENPEIRLSYSHDRNENHRAWKDKPLKIIIENGYARYIWCRNYYANNLGRLEKFVPDSEFTNNNINVLNIPKVTAEMSTRWVCTVLQEYHGPETLPFSYKDRKYTAKDLHFNLHVKDARKVYLIVNNQSLTYVTTNLSVNYDGEFNYVYEDGEDFPMDFSCKNANDNHNQDTLRLEYYNAEGIPLFQTKPRVTQPHIFRTVLKSNNDKYYLDCIRAAINPDREYRYRTTFFKRDLHDDAVQHPLILSINGQKLTTASKIDKSYDDFLFRYIDGEVLTVTCQKMDFNMRGSLKFYAEKNMTPTLRSYIPSEGVISLNISTSDIENKSVINCGINNASVEKPNARLLLLSDIPGKDVRIRGLLRNNILYQYTNDLDQWTIEYQYSVNDTLNLTCVYNEGFLSSSPRPGPFENPFQWKFENKIIDSAAIGMTSSRIKFSELSLTKILEESHNGTKIKCIYFPNGQALPTIKKTVEIILRFKPKLIPEAKRDEDTSGDNPERMIVPIAVGVGVAIAIITMICLVLWRKRTKRANLIENAYDNLSNQNDSEIPAFPSQWEANFDDSNYAKIDEEVMQENYNYSTDNDKSFSMPYKRQSNTSENHYTEIDDYFKPKLQTQPSNYNKQTDILKPTISHSSNNAFYNNISDSKQNTYDKLRHNNLPINNRNVNYSNVHKPSKRKSVTFRQMSNDLRPGRNYSEGNSRQDGGNNDRKLKLNNDGYFANAGQDIYMQPGDMHKKPNYENNFLQNEKTGNPLESDYAEPYDELGLSCKNDFYG